VIKVILTSAQLHSFNCTHSQRLTCTGITIKAGDAARLAH